MTCETRSASTCGQRPTTADRLGGAGPQDRADDQHPDRVEADPLALGQRPDEEHEDQQDGQDPPAPAGDDGPLVAVAGGLPDQALDDLAAVERHAREEVQHRERAVDDHQPGQQGARPVAGRAEQEPATPPRRAPRWRPARRRRSRPAARACCGRPRTTCARPRGSRRCGSPACGTARAVTACAASWTSTLTSSRSAWTTPMRDARADPVGEVGGGHDRDDHGGDEEPARREVDGDATDPGDPHPVAGLLRFRARGPGSSCADPT